MADADGGCVEPEDWVATSSPADRRWNVASPTQCCPQPRCCCRRDAKRLMRGHQREQVLAAIRTEGEVFTRRLRSPEAQEAFQAFLQKRKPDFSRFE
jgi:hypothetical protein